MNKTPKPKRARAVLPMHEAKAVVDTLRRALECYQSEHEMDEPDDDMRRAHEFLDRLQAATAPPGRAHQGWGQPALAPLYHYFDNSTVSRCGQCRWENAAVKGALFPAQPAATFTCAECLQLVQEPALLRP